jgi:hypothetical protein
VLVCISAGILVQAMQHSLIAGLGLFGVLSMIRFRTDLKTPRDLVFVMGAACVGVGCGAGAVMTAAIGALLFSAVSIYLQAGPFGSRLRYDGVLRFRVSGDREVDKELEELMKEHCLRDSVLSVGDAATGSEHIYQVKFLDRRSRGALLDALRERIGAHDIRLLLQDATAEQ